MADRCANCGAELFAGQQFCRACGKPTRTFSGEDVQTQMLPPDQSPSAPPPPPFAGTSPLHSGRNTDPAFGQNYAAYQSPLAAAQAAPPQAAPPRRSRAPFWIAAALMLIVLAAGGSALIVYLIRESARSSTVKRVIINPPNRRGLPQPPPPPIAPGALPPAVEPVIAGETALDETGAEVNGDETIITKTFKLADGATLSIQNFTGPIAVEGWDSNEAAVKIIKRGGSEAVRQRASVMHTYSEKQLSFRTSPELSAGLEEVEYEVKLPRKLASLKIGTLRSDVELSDLDASVAVNVQQGDIELRDVRGTVNTQTTQGHTEVSLDGLAAGATQTFNVIQGNLTLRLSTQVNADLQAETINGDIEIDDDFGVKVEKRMVGQHAAGSIGKGGPRLTAKAISGDVKIEQ